MVEAFSLHRVDEAMDAIDRLGVTVRLDGTRSAIQARNVQIDSDNGFACRLPADRNGAAPP